MLAIEDLDVAYGAIPAVRGLSLTVQRGQLVALLGANGAGKSSTLNAVGGLLRPAGGRVTLEGRDVTGWPAHRVARAGMAVVPEGRMVIGSLTVAENLELSSYARGRRRSAELEDVFELFPILHERREQPAALMSGGEQQMLSLARALLTDPHMLLLDEPSMGLAPSVVDDVFRAIRAVHARGLSILLVEQNAALAMPLADHVVLVDRGEVVSEGTAEEVGRDPATLARLLGVDEDVAVGPAS